MSKLVLLALVVSAAGLLKNAISGENWVVLSRIALGGLAASLACIAIFGTGGIKESTPLIMITALGLITYIVFGGTVLVRLFFNKIFD